MTLPLPTPEPPAAPRFVTWVAELVHAHRARLLRDARRRGLEGEDALDTVQDAFASFLTLPEARGIAEVGDDALRLLTVILRHSISNRRRKRLRHQRGLELVQAVPTDSAESSEELLERAEDLARVTCCLGKMTQLQRAVIMLSLVDERPREEVGTLLGISAGHVRVLLHRARAHVRACPVEPESRSGADLKTAQ